MARPSASPWRLLRVAALAALCCTRSAAAPVPGQGAEEYDLKARIIQIIGSYITWPQPGPGDNDRPFVIAVLGRSPFRKFLDEACRGKRVQSRLLQVVYLEEPRPATVAGCSILFICASESDRLPLALTLCQGKPIFIMGDSPTFARRGVMLNLLVDSGTIGLEVNLKAVRAAGLEINPAVLSLSKNKSKIVEPG